MPGKRSQLARRDALARAGHAFASGEHDNPFSPEDRRHGWFASELKRLLAVDHDLRDLYAAHGTDTATLRKQPVPHPGPVVPYAALA